jgi:hypothetical protein
LLTKELSKTKPAGKILKIMCDILLPAVGRRMKQDCTEFTVALTVTVKQ